MPDPKTLAAELMAAAEKATHQGQWRFSPWHIEEGASAVRAENYGIVCTTAGDNTAQFIAICSPDNIRTLCESHMALESESLEGAEIVGELKGRLAEAERERDALKRDLAMRPSSLTTLYEVRKAMGLNEYFPLSHLETHFQSARRVLYGEPIPPANESLLDLAGRMRRSLHDYQARVIPAESKIVELEGRVADLEAELASARHGILPDYPPDYPGGFDGPTGAD